MFLTSRVWVILAIIAMSLTSTELLAAKETANTVTVISTIEGLQNMLNNLAGNYVLSADIDASQANGGQGFVPVGSFSQPFTGTLDGQGHTVSDLSINPGFAAVGLFGRLGANASVSNIRLVNISISVGSNIDCGGLGGNCIGGVAGWNDGTISGSFASVLINVAGIACDGGLVGFNSTSATLTNDSASGSITNGGSGSADGGLACENWGKITNSTASVSVSGAGGKSHASGSVVGGLAGFNFGTISLSSASGAVSGQASTPVGGLVGVNESNPVGVISQSFAIGMVTIGYGGYGGGLVGENLGQIQQSFATGAMGESGSPVSTTTSASTDLGGLVGMQTAGGTILQSYAIGTVSGPVGSALGGLVGDECYINNPSPGSVTQSYSVGAVEGPLARAQGGLIGVGTSACNGPTTSSSYWDTQASFQSSSDGGSGDTTQQLQSGTLPSGFDPAVWTASPGTYPQLRWQPITGFVSPKYIVLGVTYAPPGPSSFVQYQNSTEVGTTLTFSESFEVSNTFSISLKSTMQIFGLKLGQSSITNESSTTATQSTKDESAVTTKFQVQQSEKTLGTPNFFAPVNHDYDVIWIWLNPVAIVSISPSTHAVVWNGFGFDLSDQSDLDIVGIPLGYLNGDFGSIPPQFQASFNRAWASGQNFPSGHGPALTSDDLAQIAAADPFFSNTYGPTFIGSNPPQSTADGRFTVSACNGNSGFPYDQAPPSGGSGVSSCTLTYTNASQQTQTNTTTYIEEFSVSATLAASDFITDLEVVLKDSTKLTWTTVSQTQNTTTTTANSMLSVQGPPCNNAVAGQGPCVPVYDAAGDEPTQFTVYVDNLYNTFMFAPVGFSWPGSDFAVTVAANANTASPGGSIQLTATLTPIAGYKGSVLLQCDATSIGAGATCTGPTNAISLASGPATATVTVNIPTLQGNTFKAGNFNVAVQATDAVSSSLTHSSGVTVHVTDFSMPPDNSLTQTVAPGMPATYQITLTPQNGFSGSAAFSCASGLPTSATCSFNPPNVILPAQTTTTLTITSPSKSTSLPVAADRMNGFLSFFLLALLLSAAAICRNPTRMGRRWRLASVLMGSIFLCFLISCGGGGGSTPAPMPTVTTSTIIVQVSSGGDVKTMKVILNVQSN